MLFDFSLRPLKEVQPWGKPPDLSLSWFGFTDGFYRLQVGADYLLNYSKAFVDYCTNKFPQNDGGSYVDYYVVRLWEDLLDMFPAVLEPLPPELCSLFEENKDRWFFWESDALRWLDHQEDEDTAIDTFELAVSWQRDRRLDAGYLQNTPRIWIWSTERTVIVSWDNRDITFENVQVWSATVGHYSMNRDKFLNEVREFNNKLMIEMEQRTKLICEHWDRPEIYVNLDHLQYEQQERATWLDQKIQNSPASPNWDGILSALSTTQLLC